MKKFLLTLLTALTIVGTAFGENLITVSDFVMSQTGTSDLMVNINLDEKYSAKGMKFTIELPEGVEFASDEDEFYKSGAIYKTEPTLNPSGRKLILSVASTTEIKGSKGLLYAFKIRPTASFEVGQKLTGSVYDVQASISDAPVNLGNSSFNITVTDCVVLDENSPFRAAKTNAAIDILVRRTIKAGDWSTICFPFAIDESSLKSIFGTDVQLAEYDSYTYTSEPDEELAVNFVSSDLSKGIVRNTPYLIKTSIDISEFKVKARIYASDNATKYDDAENGSFVGIFVADNIVPNNALFISDNQFYYSIGTTRMKAFRGYFEFTDILANPSKASTRAIINIGDGTTGIRNAKLESEETGKVYSMTGQYMGERESLKSLPKGVYIIDGKKVINK